MFCCFGKATLRCDLHRSKTHHRDEIIFLEVLLLVAYRVGALERQRSIPLERVLAFGLDPFNDLWVAEKDEGD
jgi:hypothetical protein